MIARNHYKIHRLQQAYMTKPLVFKKMVVGMTPVNKLSEARLQNKIKIRVSRSNRGRIECQPGGCLVSKS